MLRLETPLNLGNPNEDLLNLLIVLLPPLR
jgi:hypothetical protein